MKIEEILRRKGHEVVTIRGTATVLDAVQRLVEHDIGSLVVEEDGHLLGIFTERDVLRLTARVPGELPRLKVEEVMTREVRTGTPEDEVSGTMDLMTEQRIRHLPVMDDGRLAGIISIGDLLNACRLSAEDENEQLRSYIHGVRP